MQNVQTGQIQCFNDRDIEQVVKYITSLDQEKHQIFIVSSPRTGKYILEVNKHTESAKLIENLQLIDLINQSQNQLIQFQCL